MATLHKVQGVILHVGYEECGQIVYVDLIPVLWSKWPRVAHRSHQHEERRKIVYVDLSLVLWSNPSAAPEAPTL